MLERLVEIVLHNRLLILAAALVVAGGGIWAYNDLPLDAFPDVSPNLVQVFTVTEGLAPEEIEKYVTFPIESVMTGLPGVEKIRSVSNFGLSVVNVYFEDDLDIYFARQLVGERLQEARELIPGHFGQPKMGPISTGMGLVLFYYMEDTTGSYSLTELRTMQDWIVKYQLQNLPGVTEVLGIGGYEKQYQVTVDPHALLRYDLTLEDVIEGIRADNLNVGAQFLVEDREEVVIRSLGLVGSTTDIERIVVDSVDGTPIRVGDVAEVGVGGAIRRGLQTHDGVEEVIAGQVVKLFGANASEVIAQVEQRLEEVNRMLPEGVRIVPYYEQRTLVDACIATVRDALLLGIALVIAVTIPFFGRFRPSLIVSLAIPFSVLAAMLGMRLFDISANLMSFGGIAIAIGMMVDGPIVVTENVVRRMRAAGNQLTQLGVVREATLEVLRPITFATTIVIIVFLPLFTLHGVEGKTFRPLAQTVAMTMLGALIYSLTVVPVLASLLVDSSTGMPRRHLGLGLGHRLLAWLTRMYRPIAERLVRRPAWAIAGAVTVVALGGAVVPFLGSEFTPQLQEGTLVLRLTFAPSIALEETRRGVMDVERRLLEVPEVREVVSRIGRGEVGAHTDPINSAEMYLDLVPPGEWRFDDQKELVAAIREHLGRIPGVLMNFTQPIEMTIDELLEGVRAELAIKIFGDDLQTLEQLADEAARSVQEVRGAADVQVDQVSGTPQLVLRVDREATARFGLSVERVQRLVQAAVGGETVGEVFEGVRRFPIFVRYAGAARETEAAIERLLVTLPEGGTAPLERLVTAERIIGPRQITREDGQRFISIQCNVLGRDIGSFVAEAGDLLASRLDLPPGYRVSWGGQYRLQQEANRRFAVVVPITLLLVFLLLYASFGRMRSAVLILLNIPLALVGGVAALALTGQNLSVPASVGFIALLGIALGNGMVLVSAADRLRGQSGTAWEAALEAACLRLRPVLMTALTTGLGLLPLLLATGIGSDVQRPLATVVIGGLATSTILTLFVLPPLYAWSHSRR